jgi:hypothetical protein
MPRAHEMEYGEEVQAYNENPESWDTRPEQRPRELIAVAQPICNDPNCVDHGTLPGEDELCDDCKARKEFEETNGAEYALLMQDNTEEE